MAHTKIQLQGPPTISIGEKDKVLIVVPTRATFDSCDFRNPLRKDYWVPGRPLSIRDPGNQFDYVIQMGESARLASSIIQSGVKDTLLIFSGVKLGRKSDAQKHLQIALQNRMLYGVEGHAKVEEGAADTFQNVLFSICRFREETGTYPTKVLVSVFDSELPLISSHGRALRFDGNSFSGFSTGNPIDAERSEKVSQELLALFESDPYGREFQLLHLKLLRDEQSRNITYHLKYEQSCPEIAGLLRHAGPSVYEGDLPWDHPEQLRLFDPR
jgi:hypothetical protein